MQRLPDPPVRPSRPAGRRRAAAPWIALVLSAVSAPLVAGSSEGGSAKPNILLIVMDDVGVENLACYGEGSDPPPTPTIDALAAGGVLFRNVWSYTLTSPSLAPIYTGRYGFRTGIGVVFNHTDPPAVGATAHPLALAEYTLPELLDMAGTGYRHAMIGQWHLGNGSVGGNDAPLLAGFEHFEGHPSTLVLPETYYSYTEIKDGVETPVNLYAPTEKVNDFLDYVAPIPAGQPWFVSLVFHSPHTPFHEPPAHLHTQNLAGLDPATSPRAFFKADMQALDAEIGRLMTSLGSKLDRTVIILLGDNGTDVSVTVPPFLPEHGKISLYEGGINVPLIINGPDVAPAAAGGEVAGIVDLTDVFATVLDLAGVDATAYVPPGVEIDGVSLVPYLFAPAQPSLRSFVFSELFAPNGDGIPPGGMPDTAQPGDPPVCQKDLGYGGPGSATLAICGQAVTGENATTVSVSNAPPNAAGLLAVGLSENPTPLLGGTVASWPHLVTFGFTTDANGAATIPVSAKALTFLTYSQGLHAFELPEIDYTVQVAVGDAAAPFGVTFTNAVQLKYLFERSVAIRDPQGYKLILTDKGGSERMFDLLLDPWELNNLLAPGPLQPGTPEEEVYQELKSRVHALYLSEML